MPPHPAFPRPDTPGRPPWYENRFQNEWWRNWQFYKTRTLDRAGGCCEWCGGEARDVHHLTYENFGQESYTDLVALCVTCHREGDAARLSLERWLGLGTAGPSWYLTCRANWPEPPVVCMYTGAGAGT